MAFLSRSLMLAATLLGCGHAAAAEVTLYLMEVPPLTLNQPERKGIGGDLVLAAMRRAGYSARLQVVPSMRAMALVQNQASRDELIIPLARQKEREPHYSWIAPIVRVQRAFFSLDHKVQSFEQARNTFRTIAVARGTAGVNILREQGGVALLATVEEDRVTAIQRREGEVPAAALAARVRGRPPAQARDLVRAFSAWFQAVNLAEKVHRIRRRREYFLKDSARPQPGGIEDALNTLKAAGLGLDGVMAILPQLQIQPVFTAHPTEATRRTMLRKQQRVAQLLLDRLDPTLTPGESRAVWNRVRAEITAAWQTEDHPRERLTVADEREHVLFYLGEVLYQVVPDFYEEVAEAL